MPSILVWGEGQIGLWTPNGSVDVPKKYEFLPSGDAALTRAVKAGVKRNRLYVVMKKVHKRFPSRRIGMWAPASIIAAERERLAGLRTDDHKVRLVEQRRKREERDIRNFRDRICEQFPSCPAEEAQSIAEHACEVSSGRVGRSSTADDPVRAAVVAHIRHEHTDYDELLESSTDDWMDYHERQEVRFDVREKVRSQIDAILRSWEGVIPTDGRQSTVSVEEPIMQAAMV